MAEFKEHSIQYTEFWHARTGLTFGVRDLLFNEKSDFQKVQVWDTDFFGRVLTLDGLVMVTDRDEFVYHEMISHPALMLLREPKRALIIGGGDGGTAREVLKHRSIEHVDLVEIDQVVVDASRKYFPHVAEGFNDPRLHLRVQDGVKFVADAKSGSYDFVMVDATDPIGIAEGLFGPAFYQDVRRLLTPQGILVSQTESPFDPGFGEQIVGARKFLQELFPVVETYLAFIPTYPMGMWSFTLASQSLHPLRDFDSTSVRSRITELRGQLQYYSEEIHPAAFALPPFVKKNLGL